MQATVGKPGGDWKEASMSAVQCSCSKLLLKGTLKSHSFLRLGMYVRTYEPETLLSA